MSPHVWPDIEADLIAISDAIHALDMKIRFGPDYLNKGFDLGLLYAAARTIESEIDTDADSWKAKVDQRFKERTETAILRVEHERCVADRAASVGPEVK